MGWLDKLKGSTAARTVQQMPDDGPVAQAAMDALDTLELLLPRGWQGANVKFEQAGERLRVKKIDAKMTAAAAREPYADLGFDRAMWTAAAGAGFSRLREVLGENGLSWDGLGATCERQELTSGKVTLLGSDSRPSLEIPICQKLARGQLVNAELLRFLSESSETWAHQQSALAQALQGLRAWRFDGQRIALVFDFKDRASAVVPAQVLGSYSLTEASWCWSWANRTYEKCDYERLVPFRDKAFGFLGLGGVWRPGYFCDQKLVGGVALLVTSESGGATIFTDQIRDDLRVYYALMDTSQLDIEGRALSNGPPPVSR